MEDERNHYKEMLESERLRHRQLRVSYDAQVRRVEKARAASQRASTRGRRVRPASAGRMRIPMSSRGERSLSGRPLTAGRR